ncbi:ferric reduction oxidase 8, mitochondrial isoform X2 [Andrographis paniculata]|uniref:ferric reduction oxidase 8, mitochondrial isoform X2 n=1 Tax=Andrographis paniculata TaxID=175694 RepID=UPI0021E93E5B|nr:ferric reduction oxidase 8, mitochondrial isoform X2 [Andrographis paniculata]
METSRRCRLIHHIRIQRKGYGRFTTSLSSPLLVNPYVGILSGLQILVSLLFVAVLVWTFSVRISNDFKKITPAKSLKLSLWQYKLSRMATRCGLLSEACLALLFIPVLRGMSLFRVLGIQFEASVRYHVWLGNALVFFATLHGAGTLFIWGVEHKVEDEIRKWQKNGRIYLAGEMALATALIMWITTFPRIRRKQFRLFFYTHHLYIVFMILFLFHGGDRHFYMVFPGIFLFAVDKLQRLIQSRPCTCIVSARVFPSKAMELTLPKDPRMRYTPTSVIFLKIPSISKVQWHPFSVTSTSSLDENTISVIIKCEGQWTSSLYSLVHNEHDLEEDQMICVPVAIEGPYGPASLDFIRYKYLLLISGGIGVTPFLSILKEISSNSNYDKNHYPHRIQLIYTIKQSQDLCILESIFPYLLNTEKFNINLRVFVTRENFIGTTLRDVLGNIPEPRVTTFSTTCAKYAAYGPERLLHLVAITMASSIVVVLSLITFNYFVIPPAKAKKVSSSWVDFFLLCSFLIALACSILMGTIIKWRRVKKVNWFSDNKEKTVKLSSLEAYNDLDKHEILFGERPNFQEIVSSFGNESGESNVGVLVCGPESMKESVALACRRANRGDKGKKQYLSFHSLNFTL